VCVDVDPVKVNSINSAQAPIHEIGLPELLKKNVGTRLSATANLQDAVLNSEITLIAVGTPAVNGRIGLHFIERAAAEIGAALKLKTGYHVVVVKSTVVPGTTDTVVRRELERASGKRAGVDFGVGMNPEFLTEGTAVVDFEHPDRIVLGGMDARSQDCLQELYAPFDTAAPRIRTNNGTAEMIKYASNCLLATMISYSNEVGRLCSAVGGIDVADVMRGVHASAYLTSRRDGQKPVVANLASFLEAGCGFGGSCLPKDVTALIAQGKDQGLDMALLSAVLQINYSQPAEMLKLARKHRPNLQGAKVTVLGLAFKPDTDDIRESPAFPVLRLFRDQGAVLTAYDPIAKPLEHEAMQGVMLANSTLDAIRDADIVVLVTRWDEFRQLPQMLKNLKRSPLVIDGRRVLSPADFATYEGIGR
jgi:UDPglucose 6-dehydrogenase/GDP-mannose 6-dehydrogenase